MAYINSTRTVVNNVGTDIALAGAGNLFTVSGSLGGTKSLTLSDGFINNGAPEANLIVPLLFPNGHNDLGPSLYLEITVAGVTNPIPVVSNQNGTLLPIPHHEMTEGGSTVYKVVDPNTILNVYYTADYDGNQTPAFVVVGNPLVLSSSTYSIYANGYNDFVNNCELSDFEEINKSSLRIVNVNTDPPSSVDYTCPYDGFLLFSYNYQGAQGPQILFSEDGVSWKKFADNNHVILGMFIDTVATRGGCQIFVKKGWKIAYISGENQDRVTNAGAFWYKKRDYSNR